jgi:hypothetical protein
MNVLAKLFNLFVEVLQHLSALTEQLKFFCLVCQIPHREQNQFEFLLCELLQELDIDLVREGLHQLLSYFF